MWKGSDDEDNDDDDSGGNNNHKDIIIWFDKNSKNNGYLIKWKYQGNEIWING